MTANAHSFVNYEAALAGAIIAGVSQSRGSRVTVLHTVAVLDPRAQVVAPRREGVGPAKRYFTMPYAIRFCSGHDLSNQPFVNLLRLNGLVDHGMMSSMQASFHVTTVEAAPSILQGCHNCRFRGVERDGFFELIFRLSPVDL